ncbi:MAG: FlgD immunoglobulin-like domain containing protein [Candidatus Latescibacterota bacterium]|nr:FlgD immunoglobulin-like domain containing protein [Candidatus Latescibacterota bacterium]
MLRKLKSLFFGLLLISSSPSMAAKIEISSPMLIETNRVELGQTVPVEIVIDTEGEIINGYSIYLSYDPNVLSVDPVSGSDGKGMPFLSGDFLDGIMLQNSAENKDEKVLLSYVEAVGGAPRQGVKGKGVVAHINFKVLRRISGDTTSIVVEEAPGDYITHYVYDGAPGREIYFNTPIESVTIHVTGFRMDPLPDIDLIEGKSEMVFDLDQYVDTLLTDVFWTHSRLSEISTFINEQTNQVTMRPDKEFVGRRRMIFTAYELNEGISVSDTISLNVRSAPVIKSLPAKVGFLEDGEDKSIDLDSKVTDLDDDLEDLIWEAKSGDGLNVKIDPISKIVTFTTKPDYFGNNFVDFFVTDSDGLTDSLRVPVEVIPVNDPPEAFAPSPIYPVVNGPPITIPLEDFFTDVDDSIESLQVFFELQDGVRAELSDNDVLIYGTKVGRSIVTISAQDLSGLSIKTRQIVIVLEEGQSIGPELDQFSLMRIPMGGQQQLILTDKVTDDQSQEEIIWTIEPDSGFVANIIDGVLYVAAEPGFKGMGEVGVTATDRQGNFDREVITVYMQQGEDGLGPILTVNGKVGLRSGEIASFLVDDWVEDPDHQDSQLNWNFISTSGVISQYDVFERELFVRAEESLVEPAAITLRVNDPDGNFDEVTLPVLFARSGEPPKLAPLPEVNLESSGDEAKVDLDDFAYDDTDRESELIWEIESDPGIDVSYNPISHDLSIRREDSDGLEGAPLSAQVIVKTQDTSGLEKAGRIDVGLPPVFELFPFPAVELYSGSADSSLLLTEYVLAPEGRPSPVLVWSIDSTNEIVAEIDSSSNRLYLRVGLESFTGSQSLELKALDRTGRIRTSDLRVVVNGLGLSPQLRSFPRLEILQGNIDSSVDLDDYVVDDNPDSKLQWSVSGHEDLPVSIDPDTRILTVDATETQVSIEVLHFIVRDPAGNVDVGSMEVGILRGGNPPTIGQLPQVILKEGGREQQIDLKPYIVDEDTPVENMKVDVEAEAGVAARISDGQLILSVPGGQRGNRTLKITATDPQGNVDVAELKVLIDQDEEVPELSLDIVRHPIFSEELGISISADEALMSPPLVTVGQDSLSVKDVGPNTYKTAFIHPGEPKQSIVYIEVKAQDLAGNVGIKRQEVSLSWMDDKGGNIRSPDPEVMLNVPSSASRPGQLAVVYKLDPQKVPGGSEGEPVYSIDLERGKKLRAPVTVNFLTSSEKNSDLGLLRWDDDKKEWVDLPTSIDPQTGWLSTTVEDLGLFRKGVVSPDNRLENDPLRVYPNPFRPGKTQDVRVDYRVKYPGEIRLYIFNALGTKVRTLTDEYQEVGAWSVGWDGSDDKGMRVASGVYYFELQNYSRRERAVLVLIR